jgi:hypothetical protein
MDQYYGLIQSLNLWLVNHDLTSEASTVDAFMAYYAETEEPKLNGDVLYVLLHVMVMTKTSELDYGTFCRLLAGVNYDRDLPGDFLLSIHTMVNDNTHIGNCL